MSFEKVGKFLGTIASPLTGSASIIGSLFSMGKDYLEDKREEKKSDKAHKAALKSKKQAHELSRDLNGDTQASNLDSISMSDRGYKDDWLLILTTMPLTIMFFEPVFILLASGWAGTYVAGDAVAAVQVGFDALQEAPEYYWYALALIYIDTFGFRRMLRVAIEKYLVKKFS